MKKPLSALAIVLLCLPSIAYSQLVITEVMPSNEQSIKDEDGERTDWFEIYNHGSNEIELGDFAVTDDKDQPLKWRMPNRKLKPGEFAVLFASGKDRRPENGELHTNFKLSSDGEYLALVNAVDKNVVHEFAPTFPSVHKDQSFGLRFDKGEISSLAEKKVVAFDDASPGEPNAEAAQPRVAAVRFSVPHGFYEKPTKVALSTETPGATIRYTTDGTVPTEKHGTAYSKPLNVTTTTVLRVAAFKDGNRPTASSTATYVFPRHVAKQSADPEGWPSNYHPKAGWGYRDRRRPQPERNNSEGMKIDYAMSPPEMIDSTVEQVANALRAPTLSLVTDQTHFFDEEDGIFQNSERRGRESERPVSVELIDPTGAEKGFQINAGVRIRGGHSRRHYCQKHSMRLYFRSEYGPNKLNYPLFGDEGVKEFDDIDLRTAQNYSFHMSGEGDQNTMIREVFSRDSQAALGQPYARSRYYHLYINGLYWGLYQTQEHIEASYARNYFGGNESDYDAIKSRAGHGGLPTDGTADGWRTLWESAGRVAAAKSEVERTRLYNELQGLDPDGKPNKELPVYLDVDNLIDYMLVIFLTGNFDGPITNFASNRASNNWFSICKRNGRDGFKFFCHDSEHTLGGMRQFASINRVGPFPAGEDFRQSNPQWIHQQLLAVDAYCERFRERAEQTLMGDGPLSLEQNLIRLRHRAQDVNRVMLAEIARWGNRNSRRVTQKSHWDEAVKRVEGVLRLRAELVPRQLADAKRYDEGKSRNKLIPTPLFNSVSTPGFRRKPDNKGTFQLPQPNAKSPNSAMSTIYYTTNGTDPRGEDDKPHASAKTAEPDRSTATTFMGKESPVRVYVPDDDSLGKDWLAPDFDDSDWMKGRGGVGYDIRNDYRKLIGVDVQQKMHNKHPTAYVRYSLEIDEVPDCDRIVLRLNFEDGIIAYLNGKPIARRNALPNPIWNSQASQGHGDPDAHAGVAFNITQHRSLFRRGKNVLAFHLMNEHLSSSDLVLFPQLRFESDIAGTIVQLEDNGSPTIMARVLRDGKWSHLLNTANSEAATSAAASATNLIVSEIMYHPAKPSESEVEAGFKNENDFEFLEFVNNGEQPIDLSGVFCREGLYFLLSKPMVVQPGGRAVLAANPAAYEMRNSKPADGQFLGRLANGGEVLTIRDANGKVLTTLQYSNKSPWPDTTDGKGHSLVLKNEALSSNEPDLSNPSNWVASEQKGGTPGS